MTCPLSPPNSPASVLTRACVPKWADSARKASSVYAIERTTSLMLEQYEKLKREYMPRKGNWAVRLQKLLKNFEQ